METHSLETTCRLVGLDQKAEKVMGPNGKVPDLALERPQVRAHNPKVVGSNPTPATKEMSTARSCALYLF